MPLVAGVDSSTTACKVEVRDVDTGELVASGRAPHPPTTPPRSEQHPYAWRTAFEAACAAAGIPERHGPAAISVAAQQHGLVVSDVGGEILRPAKLWNDTESAPDALELIEALPGGATAWAEACGSVPVASFTITKLHWLRRCEPGVFARIARVQLPHDWLTAQLTGRSTTDRGDASGTGWWSPAEERYRFDLLALVDPSAPWDQLLPQVLGPVTLAGIWESTRALVGPGTGDNMAAALGLGLQPGDLGIGLGTSGTAFCLSRRPSTDDTGAVAGFADAAGRYLPLVCTLNGTKVTDAMARILGVTTSGLDALALSAPPGAAGLVLAPYFDGERTPNRPDATGVLRGIRSDVTREQLARAAFEGVVCNLLDAGDHLPCWERGGVKGRLVFSGGGASSVAYRQVLADLTGREVCIPDHGDVVARGAAVQAAAVLTGASFDQITSAWELQRSTTIEPDTSVDRAGIRASYAEGLEA